jgi:hypothetical protein
MLASRDRNDCQLQQLQQQGSAAAAACTTGYLL